MTLDGLLDTLERLAEQGHGSAPVMALGEDSLIYSIDEVQSEERKDESTVWLKLVEN